MKRVLIVCGSGVTSSLIARELNKKLESQGYYIVNANTSYALKDYHYFDLIIVAPQVKFLFHEIFELCQPMGIKCDQLDFNEYTSSFIEKKIKTYLPNTQSKILRICFVKDDQSGYLSQLFINKMKEEFYKNKCEVFIDLKNYSEFSCLHNTYDYVLFEPKLMFKMAREEKNIYIRNSDFHSLNSQYIVEDILNRESFSK